MSECMGVCLCPLRYISVSRTIQTGANKKVLIEFRDFWGVEREKFMHTWLSHLLFPSYCRSNYVKSVTLDFMRFLAILPVNA